MVQWFKRTLAILLTALMIIGCGAAIQQDSEPHGQILLWHGWSGPEAAILDQLLDQFMAIYPQVTIVRERKPLSEIGDAFLGEAILGTGPTKFLIRGPGQPPRPVS